MNEVKGSQNEQNATYSQGKTEKIQKNWLYKKSFKYSLAELFGIVSSGFEMVDDIV